MVRKVKVVRFMVVGPGLRSYIINKLEFELLGMILVRLEHIIRYCFHKGVMDFQQYKEL